MRTFDLHVDGGMNTIPGMTHEGWVVLFPNGTCARALRDEWHERAEACALFQNSDAMHQDTRVLLGLQERGASLRLVETTRGVYTSVQAGDRTAGKNCALLDYTEVGWPWFWGQNAEGQSEDWRIGYAETARSLWGKGWQEAKRLEPTS